MDFVMDYVDPINYKFEDDKDTQVVKATGFYEVCGERFTGKIVQLVNNNYRFVYDKPNILGNMYVFNYFTIENGKDQFLSVNELIEELKLEYGNFTITY